MISIISGKILETGGNHVVVLVGGLGYKVYVTGDTLEACQTGSNVQFWTHLAVREDALDLYGFKSRKEKDIFELLMTVSGIGPKSALNILSSVAGETLMNSIRTGSTAHLTKISGIGKKTAERMVLELRDKMDTRILGGTDEVLTKGIESDLDAIEALKALGYSPDESRDALKKVSKDISDVGQKVKAALKVLN